MAAKDIWDCLPATAVTPDYATTPLTVTPNEVLVEEGEISSLIHTADDGSEVRIAFSTTPVFYVTLKWVYRTDADAGTIFDYYFDSSKGAGTTRSFKWTHPTDGKTYTVRFAEKISRSIRIPELHSLDSVKLKILGRAS